MFVEISGIILCGRKQRINVFGGNRRSLSIGKLAVSLCVGGNHRYRIELIRKGKSTNRSVLREISSTIVRENH